jgi:hypothetical protein
MRGIKVPTGFSSNIKSLISMKDLTVTGYNSHDCHVMLTVFLPIFYQGYQSRVCEDGDYMVVILL